MKSSNLIKFLGGLILPTTILTAGGENSLGNMGETSLEELTNKICIISENFRNGVFAHICTTLPGLEC